MTDHYDSRVASAILVALYYRGWEPRSGNTDSGEAQETGRTTLLVSWVPRRPRVGRVPHQVPRWRSGEGIWGKKRIKDGRAAPFSSVHSQAVVILGGPKSKKSFDGRLDGRRTYLARSQCSIIAFYRTRHNPIPGS